MARFARHHLYLLHQGTPDLPSSSNVLLNFSSPSPQFCSIYFPKFTEIYVTHVELRNFSSVRVYEIPKNLLLKLVKHHVAIMSKSRGNLK
ncbi:Protein of unknown function [Pyronema omphalodes CBS 100304]|uniref:Uncharacterized protein n=1 Tax=Pyronema omphalodes (strain CBS 100304) TaxID=1076935 RepID=U4LC01_PYROM|nr:Protein of unknown function [Pyronema omphalodes CBS 100304]